MYGVQSRLGKNPRDPLAVRDRAHNLPHDRHGAHIESMAYILQVRKSNDCNCPSDKELHRCIATPFCMSDMRSHFRTWAFNYLKDWTIIRSTVKASISEDARRQTKLRRNREEALLCSCRDCSPGLWNPSCVHRLSNIPVPIGQLI